MSQDEHRILFASDNEHSNSNNCDPSANQTGESEGKLFQMADGENKGPEALHNGFVYDRVHAGQGDPLGSKTVGEPGNANKTPEMVLDEIEFSDDETEPKKVKMTENVYEAEMKKVCQLYEEQEGTMNKYTGTKNEAQENKEIPQPFELTSDDVLLEAGVIEEVVEDKVVVCANVFNGVLDLDNIIFSETREPLGYLDDVFGQIENPFYLIRLFPGKDAADFRLFKGQTVNFVKAKARQVDKTSLLAKKGCDASNAFDEELLDDEMEFSDDEQEKEVIVKKKQQKNKNKVNKVHHPGEEMQQHELMNSVHSMKQKFAFNNRQNSQMQPNFGNMGNPNQFGLFNGQPNFGFAQMNQMNQMSQMPPHQFNQEYTMNPSNSGDNTFLASNFINSYTGMQGMFMYGGNNQQMFGQVNQTNPSQDKTQANINFQRLNPFSHPGNDK